MVSARTDMTDIRDWLREHRPDLEVQPKGQLRKAHIAVYREAHAPGDGPADDDDTPALTDETVPAPGPAEVPPEAPGQRPGWLARRAKAKRTDLRQQRAGRRVPVDGLLSMGWAAIGRLMSNPATLPVGRVMELQAPSAGLVLDDALRGSMADRILQPFARASKRGEAFFAVAGPPILVAAVCRQPELYDVVRPMLREALKSWVLLAGPKMRRAKEREAKLMEELDGDMTSIDAMIDALFAAVPEGVPDGAEPARAAA